MSGHKEMRAIRVANHGGPEVLKIDPKVPVPVPSDTQVLVEVKAAGVNPVDTYIRSGTFRITVPLPYTPGSDVAGIVSKVGAKVTKFKPGDKVYVIRNVSGGYAEFTVAEETMVGKLPTHLSFSQGAGLGVPCYSASRAYIKAKDKVKPGNTVLVHGASGAVVGSRGTAEIVPRVIMYKEIIVTGFALWNAPPEEWVEMHQVISEGLTKGWLVPSVQKEYKLEEASLAHEEIINNSGTTGNRILIM
ncbi:hypothetical protein DPMN_030802 [Dreissena polymorpha]|uniref:Enoyl reductase (ER) domain-containing protein n=1 Tax=Dreissena polymorpha TaxID=45954 RepID=A0A9D4M0N3_DREPO|nr:hypothetical protein DPMN_030802 [Dreissena polymorpha]